MSSLSDDEIDGLANRLAMLASADGEADNAGRAVGAMARRLGLTGGQLKAMFLEGARNGGTGRLGELSGQVSALQAETHALRDTLRKAEVAARALQRDRDSLREEVAHLNAALDERRGAKRSRRVSAGIAALAVVVAAGLVIVGQRLTTDSETTATAGGPPAFHEAVVRDRPIPFRRTPETNGEAIEMLSAGTRLPVHKVLWHGLQQWVEVESKGQTGYVPSTDVNLF